eukprot:3753412-Prymnesium_polylepis.1
MQTLVGIPFHATLFHATRPRIWLTDVQIFGRASASRRVARLNLLPPKSRRPHLPSRRPLADAVGPVHAVKLGRGAERGLHGVEQRAVGALARRRLGVAREHIKRGVVLGEHAHVELARATVRQALAVGVLARRDRGVRPHIRRREERAKVRHLVRPPLGRRRHGHERGDTRGRAVAGRCVQASGRGSESAGARRRR